MTPSQNSQPAKNSDPSEEVREGVDEAESGSGVDLEEQPFNVNGPAEGSESDHDADEDDDVDEAESGSGVDLEEQPFNVNGPASSDPS